MAQIKTDIIVSGGGIAGLTAALAFGQAGFDVVCIEPNPPVTQATSPNVDLRTTAYLQPAQAFLDRIGLWNHLRPQAAALDVMRIMDASQSPPVNKDFVAKDISEAPFGWNVGNWHMRAALMGQLERQANVTFITIQKVTSRRSRSSDVFATLTDGTTYRAKLLIGADGRDSFVRTAAGIGAARTDFGQNALTFAVTHKIPHQNISTEVHLSGGPFTLVPLPNFDGMPCSAVVWMETVDKADALMEMTKSDFEIAATERSAHILGPLTLASPRSAWPIISQLADSFTAERTALVAEAAHVLPPIGAQGLNLSLGDIEVLLDLAESAPDTIGSAAMLARYQKARHSYAKTRVVGIGALNRISKMDNAVLRHSRAAGLSALHGIAPVRKALMRMGLGVS